MMLALNVNKTRRYLFGFHGVKWLIRELARRRDIFLKKGSETPRRCRRKIRGVQTPEVWLEVCETRIFSKDHSPTLN